MRDIENKDNEMNPDFQSKFQNMSFSEKRTYVQEILKDVFNNSKIIEAGMIGDIPIEKALKCVRNPAVHWRTLLYISEKLMRISPHYYRLCNMYGNMGCYNWGVDLYDVKESASFNSIKTRYNSLIAKLESMNLPYEFLKIMRVLPYQDLFCGLVFENKTDFFIQQINLRICKLYEVQDGLYNFVINLSAISANKVKAYPDYVIEAWNDFHNGNGAMWYEPPVDRQICIKMNFQWTYPFPMMIGVLKDIMDIDVYKNLKLQSARTDNYKAIMLTVPFSNNNVDTPTVSLETLMLYAELNKASLNDDIGILYTPSVSGEAISFKDSTNTTNNVSDAVDELYNSSGETRELFNGSSSGTAVTYSIENDAGFIYGVYRQFERWVNRYIKAKGGYNNAKFKFSFYLLDQTIFNRDTVSKRYKEACSLGATVVDKWMASIGMTPSKIQGSYMINKIFDFNNNFVPLSSSYNAASSESNGTGRPTAESQGEILSESGEATKDSDANKDR